MSDAMMKLNRSRVWKAALCGAQVTVRGWYAVIQRCAGYDQFQQIAVPPSPRQDGLNQWAAYQGVRKATIV